MKCENKSFFIKWYGPFSSQKKLKEWEEKQSFECKLYFNYWVHSGYNNIGKV